MESQIKISKKVTYDISAMAKLIFICMILGFFLMPSPQVYSNSNKNNGRDNMEEKIWAEELAYFTNLYSADYEGVLALTHEQFLGWPSSSAHPIDAVGSANFMKKLIKKPVKCNIKIEREGIRILNNIALTQYIIRVSFEGTNGGKATQSRITHTWIKEGKNWKLLGGMSYDQ